MEDRNLDGWDYTLLAIVASYCLFAGGVIWPPAPTDRFEGSEAMLPAPPNDGIPSLRQAPRNPNWFEVEPVRYEYIRGTENPPRP